MTRSTGIAIIGGGVIGASVAYHLAKAGVRDVLIIACVFLFFRT